MQGVDGRRIARQRATETGALLNHQGTGKAAETHRSRSAAERYTTANRGTGHHRAAIDVDAETAPPIRPGTTRTACDSAIGCNKCGAGRHVHAIAAVTAEAARPRAPGATGDGTVCIERSASGERDTGAAGAIIVAGTTGNGAAREGVVARAHCKAGAALCPEAEAAITAGNRSVVIEVRPGTHRYARGARRL